MIRDIPRLRFSFSFGKLMMRENENSMQMESHVSINKETPTVEKQWSIASDALDFPYPSIYVLYV